MKPGTFPPIQLQWQIVYVLLESFPSDLSQPTDFSFIKLKNWLRPLTKLLSALKFYALKLFIRNLQIT